MEWMEEPETEQVPAEVNEPLFALNGAEEKETIQT
jgi:hypothetical protein